MTFRLRRQYYFVSFAFFRMLGWGVLFLCAAFLLVGLRGGLTWQFATTAVLLMLGIVCLRPLFLPREFSLEKDEVHFRTHLAYDRGGSGVRLRGVSHRSVHAVMQRVTRIEYAIRADRTVGDLRLYGQILPLDRHGEPIERLNVPSFADFFGVEDLACAVEVLQRAYPQAVCEKKEKLIPPKKHNQ